jgi:hypothetical protein
MKVFAVLLLASYALAHGGEHQHMFKTWSKTKAMESCWGEDNMKIYTVNMKKAVAKCNQVDAPELELPPYRSVDRFVNVMLSFARQMESNQFDQLYKMMSVINENQYERRPAYKPYKMDMYQQDMYNSDNKMDKFKMMMMFKKMMNNMKNDESFMRDDMMSYDSMKSQYNNKYGMNEQMDMHKFEKMFDMIKSMKHQEKQYDAPIASRMRSSMAPDFASVAEFFKNSFRSKRAADTDALALNDRLKEKIQHVFEEQQAKIGNMTCVLKEMNCMNAENEIDVRAMKKDAEQYNMPSVWFKNRYEEILDTCHEVATNLPGKLDEQEIVTGEFGTVNMGRVKSFMSCCQTSKQKLCMNQDIKNKIEANFGPVDEILDSFKYQITEDQLFTQVNQLLQGSEDEYM